MTKKKPTTTAAAKTGAAANTVMAGQPSANDQQLKIYEEAVRHFSQGNLDQARHLFLDVAKGPAQNIADKARSYASVCERRTRRVDLDLVTAEDHFNYGVERMNARDIERALHHLSEALAKQPKGDHILYTLALCCGIAGDGDGACENLKRAIELEPRNRILARQDPEFTVLLSQVPGLRALLSAEPSSAY
jgi:tetratricopeptide (TPR) repeat protein